MSGKITLPKPKPAPNVQPVNSGKVKAHYVGKHSFTLLQWLPGAMLTVLALTAIWGGVLIFQKANYAAVGEMACRQGAMDEPKTHCADTDLDCLTSLNSQELERARETIRARNVQMARACIQVM